MKNEFIFEIKMIVLLLVVIIVGILSGTVKLSATNVLSVRYQASDKYDQRNEQAFRDDISRRLQELERR